MTEDNKVRLMMVAATLYAATRTISGTDVFNIQGGNHRHYASKVVEIAKALEEAYENSDWPND